MLKTEIILLKHTENIPNGEKNKCGDWINWLTQSNYGRETIFCNVFKALKTFMVIPVTSCSCERSFSKLSVVKIKLRSTMTQGRLDSLLTIFIEQELAYNIKIDDVIDTFKNLTPVDRRMESGTPGGRGQWGPLPPLRFFVSLTKLEVFLHKVDLERLFDNPCI